MTVRALRCRGPCYPETFIRHPSVIALAATLVLGPVLLVGCGGAGGAGADVASTSRNAAAPEPVCSTDPYRNGTNVTAWVVRVVNELPNPVSLRTTNWTCGNWWFFHLVPGQFDGAVVRGAGGAVEKTMMKASVTPGFALVVSNEAGAEIGRFAINQVDAGGARKGLVSVGGSPFGPVATMPGGAASDGVPVTVSAAGGGAKTTVALCERGQAGSGAC